jgi:hypothetical protein
MANRPRQARGKLKTPAGGGGQDRAQIRQDGQVDLVVGVGRIGSDAWVWPVLSGVERTMGL